MLKMLPQLTVLDNLGTNTNLTVDLKDLSGLKESIEAGESLRDGTSGLVNETEFNAAIAGKVDSTAVA